MVRRIVILGDSNTYGHGCSDRMYYYDQNTAAYVGEPFSVGRYRKPASMYCWGSLLQKQFPKISVHNLSKPGNSNTGMFKDLCDFYSEHPLCETDLILLNATHIDRVDIAVTGSDSETVPYCLNSDYVNQVEATNEYDPQRKARLLYIAHLYNQSIGTMYTTSAIFACYGYAASNNIQFRVSLPSYLSYTEVGRLVKYSYPHIYNYDFSGINDNFVNLQHICADNYHPNNQAHCVYYNEVVLPMIRKIVDPGFL